MAVKQKIFIPTFISSVDYQPVRTLPHIYFYNGLKDCEPYYIQHYPSGSVGTYVQTTQVDKFPYFDNYDGIVPTTGSNSLLFFNETSVYGETPTASLYTQYWDKYVSLLYNPVTRLLNASAIIPLADYFDMELNDIIQWRGNYYHLRAINDYNLKDGTCTIQLLGPIISDAVTPTQPDCSFNFSSSRESNVPTTTLGPDYTTTTLSLTSTTQSPTTLSPTTISPTTTQLGCVELFVQVYSGQYSFQYTDCNGVVQNGTSGPNTFCGRPGSITNGECTIGSCLNLVIEQNGPSCIPTTSTTTLSPTSTTQAPFVATGGTTGSFVSGSTTYLYHEFTSLGSASLNVLSGQIDNAQLLLIGGGGGGGYTTYGTYSTSAAAGGGGGGGTFMTPLSLSTGTYNLYVGSGSVKPNNGESTWFDTKYQVSTPNAWYPVGNQLTAEGGGHGSYATWLYGANPQGYYSAGNGGAGGGGGRYIVQGVGGSGTRNVVAPPGNGRLGQGYRGGITGSSTVLYGLGGGGSNATGVDGGNTAGTYATAGGSGKPYNVTGTLKYYGAGGGGIVTTSVGNGGNGSGNYGAGGSGSHDQTGGNLLANKTSGKQGAVYIIYPAGTSVSTTTTTLSLNQFTGCGYGTDVSSTCSDASNNRTLYSDFSNIGPGATIYTDLSGTTKLLGYNNVFIDGAVWNINSSTGVITTFSSLQC